ncbi:MAG TPA: DUF4347 domain-containing protein, partial [Cellvibrionaceae bacterium]
MKFLKEFKKAADKGTASAIAAAVSNPPAVTTKAAHVGIVALEPRLMFDGALVTDVAEHVAAKPITGDAPHLEIHAALTSDQTRNDYSARLLEASTQLAILRDTSANRLTQASSNFELRTEIVFIENNVQDFQQIAASINSDKEVYILDSQQNGLEQIATALDGRTNIDALHIISHGGNSILELGTVTLNSADLDAHSGQLQAIGKSLTPDGDILLYGCKVGEDGAGENFVDRLGIVTGADIAASNNNTGAASLGGDWNLEVMVGRIDASVVVDSELAALYSHVLAIPSTTVTFESAGDILDAGGHKYSTQDVTYRVNSDNNYKFVINGLKTGMEYARNNVYKNSYVMFDPYNAYKSETQINMSFVNGQIFTPTGLDIDNSGSKAQSLVFTGFAADGTTAIKTQNISLSAYTQSNPVSLSGFTGVSTLRVTATSNSGTLRFFQFDNIAMSDIKSSVVDPTITSATYNAGTGVLAVTAANMTNGDTINPSKLTLTGEGGATYLLTTANTMAASATAFSVTLNATDKAAVNLIFNKNGTSSTSSTTFNLSAADDWDASYTSGDTSDTTNAITVSNVAIPAITSTTYDASTGVFAVTGTNFLRLSGNNNDINGVKFSFKGEGGVGATYTLTNTASVDVISDTLFNLTLSATDKDAVNRIADKIGTTSVSGTTYLLNALEDWAAGADPALTTIDLSNSVTVSNVAIPTITSATYDATSGALVVTGTGFLSKSGTTNDIVANKFTLTGEDGSTYTLTNTTNVEVSSTTSFTLTLSATDKAALNMIFNKNSTKSISDTTYNLAAAEDWAGGADSTVTVADLTGNGITVSNVASPTLTSATYNAGTGNLVVTAAGLVSNSGATNDVTVSNLTLKGEAGNAYTLTSGNVEVDSATQFTVTLNATDKRFINGLLNKSGTKSVDSTTYNISAASSWNTTLASADTTNGITASNIQTPTITSAVYNTLTGVLSVTGTNLVATVGTDNDIIVSTLTLKGLGNSTYTLTSNDVDITSATSFTVNLNSTDIAGLAAILNKSGTKASDNVTYNLEAEDDWNSDINDTDIADTTATVTVTTPAPSVSKVIQTSGDGYYKSGDTVTFDVYFDQNVTVNTDDGTPRLLLETGDNDEYADYSSGSGGKILTFSYVVQPGDTSSDLQYFDTSSLELNFSTLKATNDSAVNATLTLPGLASGNSLGELSAVIIDTTAPNGSTPDLTSGSDSGTSSSDDITNTTTPIFTGSAEVNAIVTLYDTDGTTSVGSTTADGSGNWSITASTMTEGAHTVTTKVTDAAGNTSVASTGLSITIDTTAPSAPTGLDLVAASDSGYSNSDNITNKTTPTINGTGAANQTVTLYDTDGTTVLGSSTVNGSGKWSLTSTKLSEGTHSVSAKITDIAGNVSSASSTLNVTIDLTAPVGTPGTPVMDSGSDTGSSNSDGITTNDSPSISGSGVEAGGYVQVYDGADPTPIATFV